MLPFDPSLRIVALRVLALVALTSMAAQAAVEDRADPVATLHAAATEYDAEIAGYVVERVTETIHAKGGPMRVDTADTQGVIRLEGRTIEVRYIMERDGGKDASAEQLAKDTESDNAALHKDDPQPHPVFSGRYQHEYHLSPATCNDCHPDEVAVAYDSDQHDAAHSAGEVRVNVRSSTVASVKYRPFVLDDKRMDSEQVTLTFGHVGDLWLPLHAHRAFTAHLAFIHGSGTIDVDYSAAHRYSSLSDARSALARVTL